jgi:hypothetical protein
MNYPIPVNPQDVIAQGQKSVDESLLAAAIVGVVQIARDRGQSLDELVAEVLADDALLDQHQRQWLSEVVTATWERYGNGHLDN